MMAQPFSGVARMKLFGLVGSRELAAIAEIYTSHRGEELVFT